MGGGLRGMVLCGLLYRRLIIVMMLEFEGFEGGVRVCFKMRERGGGRGGERDGGREREGERN